MKSDMRIVGSLAMNYLSFAQVVFAGTVLIVANFNPGYYLVTVFGLLDGASVIQAVWGLCLYIYTLYIRRRRDRPLNSGLLTAFVIGNWVVGVIQFAAASSSAAVMLYLAHDTSQCSFMVHDCKLAAACVVFAFCGWFCTAITALILFWVRASL